MGKCFIYIFGLPFCFVFLLLFFLCWPYIIKFYILLCIIKNLLAFVVHTHTHTSRTSLVFLIEPRRVCVCGIAAPSDGCFVKHTHTAKYTNFCNLLKIYYIFLCFLCYLHTCATTTKKLNEIVKNSKKKEDISP